MKDIFILILPVIFSVSAGAQGPPEGKTFRALTGSSCKEMANGGCTVYTFCVIAFVKDSVSVAYEVGAHCTDSLKEAGYEQSMGKKGKMYAWELQKDVLIISGFNEYGPLRMGNDQLVGIKNHNPERLLYFTVVNK
jgi:hypothetical protein